jgi:hypothetical protein
MALAKNDTERMGRIWRWRLQYRDRFITGSALGY